MKKAILAVAVLAALVATPQAFARTFIVDKDKVQCPKADFQSIQAAVAAALPGDTIKVCPDLYTESVNVNKPALTLLGSSTANIDCTILTAADPTKDSIVTGGASPSFNLANYDITLSGFVVQGDANIGIQTTDAFSGYRISDNIVQNNFVGVNFNSGGPLGHQSRVDHNCIRAQGFEGLESEVGNLVNALVDHNASFRNTGLAYDFSGAGSRQYVTVTRNSAVQDGNGYGMDNSIGSSVDHNDAVRTVGSSILIGGQNNGLAVSYNNIDHAGGDGIRFDQFFFVPVFAAPNVGLDVSYNTVTGVVRNGIRADGTSVNLSLFSNNDTSTNGLDGIVLFTGNSNNRILNNNADQNGANGIHAAGATGNTFEDNHMFLNVQFDARDDNRPANTWTGNHCTTDFPPGTICGVS